MPPVPWLLRNVSEIKTSSETPKKLRPENYQEKLLKCCFGGCGKESFAGNRENHGEIKEDSETDGIKLTERKGVVKRGRRSPS